MIPALKLNSNIETQLWPAHHRLAKFNTSRLNPQFPTENWRTTMTANLEFQLLEREMLEMERRLIQPQARTAPREKYAFMKWFEELKLDGPGQNTTLFDWLANEADYEQMRWFIRQEVAGEAGFEDLTALTQVKVTTQPKLEMARNYWDEMGRGREPGMHGPMLTKVAQEFELGEYNIDDIEIEPLALGNVLVGMAMTREYAYHSIGALGAVELTAPGRAKLVYEGLKRLGVSSEGQRYYLLHSALDIKHSEDWNRDVLMPLLDEDPRCAQAIAEGALMRLNAGARCFEKYRRHYGLA